ncbi:hypothetical protein CPB85DRAFT_1568214 [Mucidula mucida]|nr:hypothetical protein CPB85DRAFT_1568214 [Mucidula mucida]
MLTFNSTDSPFRKQRSMKGLTVAWFLAVYGIAVSARDTNAFRLARGLSPVRPKYTIAALARSEASSSPGYTELSLNGGFESSNGGELELPSRLWSGRYSGFH